MRRVASLYLPDWSIDRLRRAEPALAPPPERVALDLAALKAAGDAEQGGKQCDAPRNTGWRPGARWARDDGGYLPGPLRGVDEATGGAGACWAGETRADVARRVAAIAPHQRPPMREMGRRSEAAEHPFKRLPGDDGGKSTGWPESAVHRRTHEARGDDDSPALSCRMPEPNRAPPNAGAPCREDDARRSGLLRVQEHARGSSAAMAPVRIGGEGVRPGSRQRERGARGLEPRGRGEEARPSPPAPPSSRTCSGIQPSARASTAEHAGPWIPEHVRDGGRGQEAARAAPPRLGANGAAAAGTPSASTSDPAAVSEHRRVPHVSPALSGAWNAMPAIRYPGDGPHPDKTAAKERRPGSNDPGAAVKEVAAFFDTGRTTAGTVARVCRDPAAAVPPGPAANTAPPLVTVQKVGSRVEIAAASPAARAIGVEPGMALTQVRAATPEIVVRDADPEGDQRALHRLAVALARRWTPVVAIEDSQSLLLDLTGVAHLHGGEARLARRLVRLLARLGITARVAIADTAGAAWACAHHAEPERGGVTILPPGATLDALAPLPVASLRVDERALELLRRLGVDTVGQLAALPRAPLARRFGTALAQRLDQASGRAPEPLAPVVPPVAITVEQRFAEPLLTAEPIAHWIGQLVDRLAAELARAGRGARQLLLAATRVDAAVQTLRVGFARPTRARDHLRRLLVRRVERIDPGFGIEALTLHVQRADPLAPEYLDGDLAEGERPDLAPLVDAIVNRIGAARLWRARAVESDVPERSVAGAAPLDPPERAAPALRRDDVRRLDTRDADHPWHPRWPRPTRLLRHPEPLDHVLAELPDQPPKRFTWRGESHVVVRGDGPERIAGEWWRRRGERDAVRDYYQVEDEAGRRYWLFRRGDGERGATGDLSWYMHGTFG
ncbi:Y-family DNA polymerase [Sphingomonas citri]|nr:DNA polymerase Y family protein [Sphingomonas citri]